MPIAPEDLLVLDAAAPLPDFEPEAPAPEAVPVALTDPVAEDVAEASYVRKKLALLREMKMLGYYSCASCKEKIRRLVSLAVRRRGDTGLVRRGSVQRVGHLPGERCARHEDLVRRLRHKEMKSLLCPALV